MSKKTVGPGQRVPDSGIYQSGGKKATLVEGKPAPPTPKPSTPWKQVVDTNPKNDRRK